MIAVIAPQAFIVTQLGHRLGSGLSDQFRESAEPLAGLALTVLDIVLLAEKVLS